MSCLWYSTAFSLLGTPGLYVGLDYPNRCCVGIPKHLIRNSSSVITPDLIYSRADKAFSKACYKVSHCTTI